MLAPPTEGDSRLLPEEAFDRSLACAAFLAEILERSSIARICEREFCDSDGSFIGRHRHLQWDKVRPFQLVFDDSHETGVGWSFSRQAAYVACLKQQLPEERRDIDEAASAAQLDQQPGCEIERLHRQRAPYLNGVGCFCGNPNGSMLGNDPHSLCGGYCHHSRDAIEDLVYFVEVFRNGVTVPIGV